MYLSGLYKLKYSIESLQPNYLLTFQKNYQSKQKKNKDDEEKEDEEEEWGDEEKIEREKKRKNYRDQRFNL